MTVSRDWERVNQLFHEALDLAPDARAAFVETRAGDAHVFQEVMSLLLTSSAAEGFLSTPPDSAQVRAIVARLQGGDELGPFRITSLIGAGGMGEVYRAWDTRLDRQVAIKVLPQVSPIDDAGRERFEAEARAISHPVGSATPLGRSFLCGFGERDCLQERESEQSPALVRSRRARAGFVRRRSGLPSSPVVAR
jgi:hypothetical protein